MLYTLYDDGRLLKQGAKTMANEKLCEKFERIFDVSLEEYINISGFDIIKFDENFVKSTGSMSDAVREKFGKEAVNTIQELLTKRTLHSLRND